MPVLSQILRPAAARAEGLAAGGIRLGRLVIACVLFALIIPLEIGVESELFVSRRIFGIPPHYALTIAAIFAALATDLRYYSRLITRPTVIFGLICIAYMLLIGILRHGVGSHMVRADLYVIRWFFVGFMLMRLGVSSGLLRWYLAFAAVTVLIVVFTFDFQSTEGHQIDTSIKRVVAWSLYPVNNCGTIMISLSMMCFWHRSRSWAFLFAVCFGLLFFGGAIRTSTRSLFIQQGVCLSLVLFALARDPRMASKGQQLGRVGAGFGSLGFVVIIWQIMAGRFLGSYTQISERFTVSNGIVNDATILARFAEAGALLRSLSLDEWVLGSGLGALFYTPLGYWANTPHIAVLGSLQKGGLILFIAVMYMVYFRPLTQLAVAMMTSSRRLAFPPPILVVGPSLMGWAILTFVSGGLDNGSFLGLGGLGALWVQLTDEESVVNARRCVPQRPGMRQFTHTVPLSLGVGAG